MSYIPDRSPDMIIGSEFIKQNQDPIQRNINATKEILSGNFPEYLREFSQITVGKLSYWAMNNYLSIGQNFDNCLIPLEAKSFQEIADAFDCILPTTKMVKDTWKFSQHIAPLPWGAPYDSDMWSSSRIYEHSKRIDVQLQKLEIDPFSLISGHKKDIVLTNRLAPNNPNKRIAIFGWTNLDGSVIQGLNPTSHEIDYVDYSQCVRLYSSNAIYDNTPIKLHDAFLDPEISKLISDEGILTFQKY